MMAEAAAVIGLVSAIVDLVQFGSKIVNRLDEFQSNVGQVPQTFRDIKNQLPLLLNALQRTKTQAEAGDIDGDTQKAILSVVGGCLSQVESLDEALVKTLPAEGDSKWIRAVKAFRSVSQEKDVRRIVKRLQAYVSTLTYHQAAGSPKALSVRTKPLFTVPFERDPNFVGRSDILKQVDQKLKAHRRAALAGIGGVGKSQIAVEFCYRFNGEHPDGWVLWVHASSITRFEEAYKEIARKARLPGWHDPKVNTLKLVCEWLSGESVERWLLVLDNADNEDVFFSTKSDLSSEELERENPLANYIPRSPHGSVMITTRDERVGLRLAEREAPVAVLRLAVQDAERLLRSRTCGDDISDEADSKNLLHALGYLPLAITQAAAFISENRMTVSEYFEALRASDKDTKDLLSEELEDPRRDSRTRNSVIRTWKLSFDQIRKQKPRAAEILSLMSVLDRQGIPKSILRREDDRSIEFTTAIGTLVAFSLISAERTGENLEMHRLVQLSTQRWLEVEGKIVQWQQKALKLLSKVFPEGIFENWAICNRLVPHVQIAIKYSVDTLTCQLRRAAILNNVSVYDREQGRYGMAFDKCSEALATREKILGAEHPDTLISVSNLASVLRHQGKYKVAEEMCRRALKGKENQKDSRTLDSLSLLALVLRYRGKYEEAEEMNRRALEGREKLLGPEHPLTLTSVSDLGSVLRYQERYEAAENIHRRALEGREKVLGAENPDTLTSVSNLASVLRYQGEYVAAEEMNRRALEGREKVLGTEHPDTLTSVGIMASVLQGQGKYEAAEKMNRRVLEGREKVLGVEHPRTLISVNNLALLFQYRAKYEEAEKMHRRALEGRKRVLGVEHPDTLTSINNLASVLQKLAQM